MTRTYTIEIDEETGTAHARQGAQCCGYDLEDFTDKDGKLDKRKLFAAVGEDFTA